MALKLLDTLLQGLTKQIFADNGIGRSLGLAVRLSVLVLFFFPFLLATLQIHPQRIATKGTPADWGVSYEEVLVESRGRTLRGWHCTHADSKSAVFVAHGLNANRENFMEPVRLLHDLGHSVLIIDFPAHGNSPGRSTTLGLLEADDVRAAHDWLVEQHPKKPIHALGYSMGASAVLTAAGKHQIFDRVIVDATFSTVRRVADQVVLRHLGPLRSPIWAVGRQTIVAWTGADLDTHRPIDHIVNIPPEKLLIIHGTADKIIPFEEGVALHKATGNKAKFIQVDDYGHAETISHPAYAQWLDEFLKP